MEWTQFSIFFVGVFGMWLWQRTEANADRRDAEEGRREIRALIQAVQAEMKDFHGRLCAIEERNRKG